MVTNLLSRPSPEILIRTYRKLYKFYGPQGWWPGRSRFEIIVGAILTQNTAWANVEKAIKHIRASGNLASPSKIASLSHKELARMIRPAGYYNVKAVRLKNFTSFLASRYNRSLNKLSKAETPLLRQELLGINGIGPETCDSILLYAFGRPSFVVDAYTRRVFSRHGLFPEDLSYDSIRALFMKNLPSSEKIFNEYHALIVRTGKDYCKTVPQCTECPLRGMKLLANVMAG